MAIDGAFPMKRGSHNLHTSDVAIRRRISYRRQQPDPEAGLIRRGRLSHQACLLSQSEMDYAWHLYESRKEHFKTELFDKISKKLNTMQDGQDVENSMSK